MDDIVDLFSTLATILVILEDFNLYNLITDAIVYKDLIDSIVASDIPDVRLAIVTATHMIKYIVENLMAKQKLCLLRGQLINERSVVVKVTTISCRCIDMWIVSTIYHTQTCSEITKEAMTEQQTNAGCNKLLFDFTTFNTWGFSNCGSHEILLCYVHIIAQLTGLSTVLELLTG